MATLTALMGPPGAGKTTWVEANRQPGQVLCSTERLRLDPRMRRPGALIAYVDRMRARARAGLMEGRDVLVDACNTRAMDRSVWLRIVRETGSEGHLVVLHTPREVLVQVGHVDEGKLRRYEDEYARALGAIEREEWGRIEHVHRERTSLRPRTVSKW